MRLLTIRVSFFCYVVCSNLLNRGVFQTINKINESQANQNRDETQIASIYNERRDITTNPTDVKRISKIMNNFTLINLTILVYAK